MKYITFNLEKYKSLKLSYQKAVLENKEHFKFDGEDFATGYAKYVLENLENQWGINPKNEKK